MNDSKNEAGLRVSPPHLWGGVMEDPEKQLHLGEGVLVLPEAVLRMGSLGSLPFPSGVG